MPSLSRITALTAACTLLAACGLKGPLYFPKEEPAPVEKPAAPASPTNQDANKTSPKTN